MPAPTLDQENALLGPGWTPEQLCERWMAGTAVDLYREGSTSLDAAAKFAGVPKVWLLSMMPGEERSASHSDEDLGQDAKRYISVDPSILSGTPCLKGTRVPAHYIADWRNALCHGAWVDYDGKSGQATLRHWPRKGWREQSEQPISRADLAAIGHDAVDITWRVIEAVTSNGIQFPGSESPGEQAWPSHPE